MSERVFIDSNLWIYAAIADDGGKSLLARNIIENSQVVISTQVINEVSFNLLRKYRYTENEILFFIRHISAYYQVCQLTIQTCLNASALRQNYALSFWDSLVVASALEAECAILYSEDMQHGLRIQKMQIINPLQ